MTTLSFAVQFRKSNELDGIGLPVEVRRHNLTLAAKALTTDTIELKPGLYHVTARLPAGQELYDQVEVVKDKENVANLSPEEEDESPQERQAMQHFMVAPREAYSSSPPDEIESLGADDDTSLDTGRTRGFRALLIERSIGRESTRRGINSNLDTVLLRRFTGNVLSEKMVKEEPAGWTLNSSGFGFVEYQVSPSQRAQIVQLIQTGVPPLNMLLPTGESEGCRLTVTRQTDGHYTIDAHLEHSGANTLLRYSQKGYLDEAESTGRDVNAEKMLQQKGAFPVAAAVGAYSLLRFGELDKLHNWTENLRSWFDWLPDGVAIRGEHLARVGKHKEALDVFLQLSERGLPIFSDGLSYAVDRLRVCVKLGEKYFKDDKLEEARKLLEKLQQFASLADFREPLTTFTGLTPDAPDDKKVKTLTSLSGLRVQVP
jgi:hypothetical protein